MVSLQELILRYLRTFSLISLRYLFFAGSLYLIFYVWKKRHFFKAKIQQKYPDNKRILHEVGYSFLSLAIFSLVGTLMFVLRKHGYTQMYLNFSDHSVAYFIFSVVVFILLHDTYFYWCHRLMHWKKIYPYVHKIHHLSVNPTPWAAFAFHPLEAVMEVAIVPIMIFLIPLHPFAILAWVLYQTGMNVLGHLGFELFPAGFTEGTISKWHNTSTHHNMHHKHVNCNYGLYFNFWDRILGTNHAEYTQRFEEVKTRATRQTETEESSETIESSLAG
jgi:sterol desaturase/sphingolipid hydroxylase (fatty acid hydroxylase superfamily)